MKKFFSFTMLLVLTLCATCAFAADQVTNAPQALSAFLNNTVFPLIASLFLGFLTIMLKKLGDKYHIDYLSKKDNLLMKAAEQGVAFAQEQAARLVGSKSQLTGSQKFDAAVSYILQAMPKVSKEEAEAKATAILAMIPGVGATGEKVVSVNASLAQSTAGETK